MGSDSNTPVSPPISWNLLDFPSREAAALKGPLTVAFLIEILVFSSAGWKFFDRV